MTIPNLRHKTARHDLCHFAIVIFLFLVPLANAKAENLNPKALFYRCYSQITGSTPGTDSASLIRVENGDDPITVCLELINQVEFVGGTNLTLPSQRTPEHVKILNRFHRIHMDWFAQKSHTNISTTLSPDFIKEDIFDSSEPALYYTRAFFSPKSQPIPINSALQSNVHLRAVRTQTSNAGLVSKRAPAALLYDAATPLADYGDLVGISEAADVSYPYTALRSGFANPDTGSQRLFMHQGGGIIGNGTYLLKSVLEEPTFKADGGIQTPRTWAKHVFQDLLCRELPVARPTDTAMYVVPNSSLAFRQGASCTQCHASMDRLASTIRGFKYDSFPKGGVYTKLGPLMTTLYQPSGLPSEVGWPSEPDVNFYLRPPIGTLFFRTVHGDLIDTPVRSLHEVGTRLAATDDFYICAASRYYHYFTGIKVTLGDSGVGQMDTFVKKHFDKVVALGQELRQHQDPRRTVAEILRSPAYKTSNFDSAKGEQP